MRPCAKSYAHTSEERMQRNFDPGSEVSDHFHAVERNNALSAVWKLHR